MSASPKLLREEPTRYFEDYLLTYDVGSSFGLFPIDNSSMTYASQGPVFMSNNAGLEGWDDGDSYIELGFDFKIDNKNYQKLYVTTNGWCCLVDPDTSFDVSDVVSSYYQNETINDVFNNQHILLAPWFDDLRNVYRTLDDDLSAYGEIGGIVGNPGPHYLNLRFYLYAYLYEIYNSSPSLQQQIDLREKMRYGKEVTLPGIDSSLGGVKYYYGNTDLGRCLVVRWKSFSFYERPINFGTFDVVIYESGVIEFRYDNRSILRPLSEESATIGIFAYGGSPGYPRYRDFGSLLKMMSTDDRGIYKNGGAVSNGNTIDGSSNYIVSLNMSDHWPGLGVSGAIFRFSPPQNKRKQNRSITTLRDSQSFIRTSSNSLFNDQLTIAASVKGNKNLIEYPSMLPAQTRLTSLGNPYSISDLFQSGSIQVERENITPGLVDSVLYDSIIEGRKRSGQ